MKIRALLISMLLCLPALGQGGNGPGNIAGTLYASNFAAWSVPQGNNGQFSWSDGSICRVSSGGLNFQAFKVGTPVLIVDASPGLNEVVTPSAVRINSTGCQISVSPVHQHSSFYLTTVTAGLQEAINYANGLPAMVYVTPDFTRLGGTTGTITSAVGNAAVSVMDVRTSCPVSYVWGGSAYAGTDLCNGGGGSGTLCPPFYAFQLASGSGSPPPCAASKALLSDPTFQSFNQNTLDYYEASAPGIPANPTFPQHDPISIIMETTQMQGAADNMTPFSLYSFNAGTTNDSLTAGVQIGSMRLLNYNHGPGQGGGQMDIEWTGAGFGDGVRETGVVRCSGISRGFDEGCKPHRTGVSFYNEMFGGTLSSLSAPNAQGNVLIHLGVCCGYTFFSTEEMDFVDWGARYLSPGNIQAVHYWNVDPNFFLVTGDSSSNINGHFGGTSTLTHTTAAVDSQIYQPNTVGATCPNVTASGTYSGGNAFINDRFGVNVFSYAPRQVSASNPSNYCVSVVSTAGLSPGTLIYFTDGSSGREYARVLTVPDGTHFTANLKHPKSSGATVAWGPGIGYASCAVNDHRPAGLMNTFESGQPSDVELCYPIVAVLASNNLVIDTASSATGKELLSQVYNGNIPGNPLVLNTTVVGGVITSISTNNRTAYLSAAGSGFFYEITQTSQSGTTATYTWNNAASAPTVGEVINVVDTLNGGGHFNGDNLTITGVTGTTSGTFTVTLATGTYAPLSEEATARQANITTTNGTINILPPPVPVYTCAVAPVITFASVSGGNVLTYVPTLVSGGSGCTGAGATLPTTVPNHFNLVPHTLTYRALDPACAEATCGTGFPDKWGFNGVDLLEPIVAGAWTVGDQVTTTMWAQRYSDDFEELTYDPIVARSGRHNTGGTWARFVQYNSGVADMGLINDTPSEWYLGHYPNWGHDSNPSDASLTPSFVLEALGIHGGGFRLDLPPFGPVIDIDCTKNFLGNIDHPCLHNQFAAFPLWQLDYASHGTGILDPVTGGLTVSGPFFAPTISTGLFQVGTLNVGNDGVRGRINFLTNLASPAVNLDLCGTFTLSVMQANNNCHIPTGPSTSDGRLDMGVLHVDGGALISAPIIALHKSDELQSSSLTYTGTPGSTIRAYAIVAISPEGIIGTIDQTGFGGGAHIDTTAATLDGSHFVTIACPTTAQYGYPGGTTLHVYAHNITTPGFYDVGNCPSLSTLVDNGSGTSISNWPLDGGGNSPLSTGVQTVMPNGWMRWYTDTLNQGGATDAGFAHPSVNTVSCDGAAIGDGLCNFKAGSVSVNSAGGVAGGFTALEGTALFCDSGKDVMWADGTAHRFVMCNNGGNPTNVAGTLFGTTGTITGTALTATCDSGTASVPNAIVGQTVSVSSTTGVDVGGAFDLRALVTAAGTVTVYVCGTGTPASLAYNVGVHQ